MFTGHKIYILCSVVCLSLQFGNCIDRTQCKSKAGQNGVCLQLTECPSAYISVMRTRMHNMDRCGFEGYVEVVCCTDPEVMGAGADVATSDPNIWGVEVGPTGSPVTDPKPGETLPPVKATETRGSQRRYESACDQYSKEAVMNVQFNILKGEAANDGEFPHMAALGYPGDETQLAWNCAGSLISKRYVLTAAHCIINSDRIRPTTVRVGSILLEGWNATAPPQDIAIENITVHPEYKRLTAFNDIALIRLAKPAETNMRVNPACLYTTLEDPMDVGLMVTGWGTIDEEMINRSNSLLKATLTAVALDQCNTTYVTRVNRSLTKKQLCAGSRDGSDSCKGDSGGPLQIFTRKNVYFVVGIISYGMGCGGSSPAVYTRVASYLDWIENIVWPGT